MLTFGEQSSAAVMMSEDVNVNNLEYLLCEQPKPAFSTSKEHSHVLLKESTSSHEFDVADTDDQPKFLHTEKL